MKIEAFLFWMGGARPEKMRRSGVKFEVQDLA